MIVAGLTGSIATGKSTVARILEAAGAVVVDADEIAHAAVRRGRPAWHQVVAHFGRQILTSDGQIDRRRLGHIIFTDPAQRKTLEHIVHPHVTARIDRRLQEIGAGIPQAAVILDIPLLFEAGPHRPLDEIIVVYIPQALQCKRLMARDGLSRSAAMARIRSQMSIEEKRRLATRVIDNSGDLSQTRRQALAIYRDLRHRAGATHSG